MKQQLQRCGDTPPALGMLYVGKDVVAQPGDRVILSKEGGVWCQQRYPVSI